MSNTQPYLDHHPGDGIRKPVRQCPLRFNYGNLSSAVAKKLWIARNVPNQIHSQVRSAIGHLPKDTPSYQATYGSGKTRRKRGTSSRSKKHSMLA